MAFEVAPRLEIGAIWIIGITEIWTITRLRIVYHIENITLPVNIRTIVQLCICTGCQNLTRY
jgi:hypothetical protein